MKITKKNFSVSLKMTKQNSDKQWITTSMTEGFEVEVNEGFDELSYQQQKDNVKALVKREVNSYMDSNVEDQDVQVDIEL